MAKTGTLRYGPGDSRVDGELLAVANGEPNPLARARSYLESRGFQDGARITVTGSEGVIGNTTVFFMTTAGTALGSGAPMNLFEA